MFDLEKYSLDLFHQIRDLRASTQEEFAGLAVALDKDYRGYVLTGLGALRTSNERRFVLQSLLRQTQAVAVVVIVECWLAHVEPGRGRESLPPSLADAPNRGEALICLVENAEGCRAWRTTLTKGDPVEVMQMMGGDLYGLLEWN